MSEPAEKFVRKISDEELERVIDSILDDLDRADGIGGSKNWTPATHSRCALVRDLLLLR